MQQARRIEPPDCSVSNNSAVSARLRLSAASSALICSVARLADLPSREDPAPALLGKRSASKRLCFSASVGSDILEDVELENFGRNLRSSDMLCVLFFGAVRRMER